MAPEKPTTPPLGFTPKFLETLKPAEVPYDLVDARCPGLKLRVQPSGRLVFRWVYWRTDDARRQATSGNAAAPAAARRQTTLTIGTWAMREAPGFLTLAQARDRLEELKRAHEVGRLEEAARSALAAPSSPKTVRELAEEFYARAVLPARRHPDQVRRTLDTDILPAIGDKPLASVTTADCRAIVLRVVDGKMLVDGKPANRPRGPAPSHAGKVLDHLKQLFSWAEAWGEDLAKNPAAVLRKNALGVRTKVGKRTLGPDEVPLFWRALDAHKHGARQLLLQVRIALRLLLLVGIRTGELLKARWADVDLEAAVWTIPVENQKLNPNQIPDAKPWIVPLAPDALALFRELKRIAGRSPWVVSSDKAEEGHLTEKALSHALRGLFDAQLLELPGGRCTPHDLRRTLRTKLGDLGVALHVAERCLNHSLGRIAQTYDHYDYLKERRAALELWEGYVHRLLEPDASKVVFLAGATGRG